MCHITQFVGVVIIIVCVAIIIIAIVVISVRSASFFSTCGTNCSKTESVFEGNIDSNCFRVCGEGLCENTLLVGCEEKDCSFWRHAWCMGVTAYRKNALKNLKFYCPQHLIRNK